MFWKDRPQIPSKRDVVYAHEVAEEIKKRLAIATALGLATALTTGITAAFSFYAKDLPATIRSLNLSVERLTQHVEYQTDKNRQFDENQRRLENRVDRIEERR